MTKDYDTLYEIKQKISMSQGISNKDHDYADFAGADPATAQSIGIVKLCLKHKIYTDDLQKLMMTLYKEYLNLMRKAWFASTCGEISKLGFILGDTRETETAEGTRAALNKAD